MVFYVQSGEFQKQVVSENPADAAERFIEAMVGQSLRRVKFGVITSVSDVPFLLENRNESFFATQGLLDALNIESELYVVVTSRPASLRLDSGSKLFDSRSPISAALRGEVA